MGITTTVEHKVELNVVLVDIKDYKQYVCDCQFVIAKFCAVADSHAVQASCIISIFNIVSFI